MDVLFEPHKKQSEFIHAVFSGEYRCLLYGGAAGGGKSFVSLAILVLLSKLYPGSKWFVVRESLPTLKRTTIPSFFKLCPRHFIRNYNQTEQTVTFTNGSQIVFFPENFYQDKNLTRFDGVECNGFLIEEGQEIQEKTFNKALLRAGRHIIPGINKADQPKPLILVTCNPSNNWTKTLFHEPFIEGNLNPDYFYLRATMSDNPSLSEEYLSGLENLDDVTKAVFVRGEWNIVDVDRPFAYSFDRKKHVRVGLELSPIEPVRISFDFNVDPITAVCGQSFEDKIHILKEYRLRHSDIYELCERILNDFSDHYLIVTGDASGSNRSAMTRGATNFYQIIKQELDLSKNQIRVPSINPSLKNSRVLTNSILQNHGKIFVDASCQYLIDDLESVEVNDKGEIEKSKDARKTHLLDGFRYYLWTFHHDFLKKFA